jgi:hypothetical protein
VWVHNLVQQETHASKINTTIRVNMLENSLQLIKHKKFLLALIFALLDSSYTWLQKLGCYGGEALYHHVNNNMSDYII